MNTETHLPALAQGTTAPLQLALVWPAVLGVGFAVAGVTLAFYTDRDLSEEALRYGITSRWDRILLGFDMPARRVVDWCLLIPSIASCAWLATLALWRYLGGDRIAVASREGLQLHPTYSRFTLPWSEVECVESVEVGRLKRPCLRVTTKKPVRAWLMLPSRKITITLLRSKEQAEILAEVAEKLRQEAVG